MGLEVKWEEDRTQEKKRFALVFAEILHERHEWRGVGLDVANQTHQCKQLGTSLAYPLVCSAYSLPQLLSQSFHRTP